MREQILAFFQAQNLLVVPEALDLILASPAPLEVSRTVVHAHKGILFITPDLVTPHLSSPAPEGGNGNGEGPPAPAGDLLGPRAGRSGPGDGFQLLRQGYGEPGVSATPLEAYTELFRDRFRSLSRFLRGRPDLADQVPVKELPRASGDVSLVVMLRDVETSAKQHHLILTVEDESGTARVLVPKDSRPSKVPFLPDEALGLRVHLPREPGGLPLVREVLRPDTPATREPHRSSRPSRVLFLSDTHIGSRMFLEDAWGELMDFLRGSSVRPDLAREIRHVVIAGDLVDGIGVYPRQENDLAIPDVVEQYAELGRRLREMPSGVQVVAVPGNHDAVCPAEPQPPLSPELLRLLPPSVRILGNPSTFSLEGVVIEAYHGRSFDDLIPSLPGARYERPTEVMRRMLLMRHLSPSYGGKTPLAPLPHDGLVMDPLPDIFVTGHTHTYGVERWRGILLLNASTWLAETEYQRMRNVKPVPARAAVVNLESYAVDALDFSGGPAEKGPPEAAG